LAGQETPWFRRGWNLELLGGGGAILLIFVLVWVARQDQNTVNLSPAGSAQQEHTLQQAASTKVSPLLLSWAPKPLPGGGEDMPGTKALNTLGPQVRIEVQEAGYLLVVKTDGKELERLYPTDSSESVPIGSGSTNLPLVGKQDGWIVGVYCSFPFGFDNLDLAGNTVKVPKGCTSSDLK